MVSGVNFLFVGTVPFICDLSSSDHDNWSTAIPIPFSITKKYLPQFGLDNLAKFLHNYREDYMIFYLQFIEE